MNRRLWFSALATVAIIIGMSSFIWAQETTGSIVGTAMDASGGAVAGATVTITDPAKGNIVVRTATTSDDGSFAIPNLPVSTYTVTIEAHNFKRSVNSNV